MISGATRATSNQPAFIVPNGAAASFTIDGTPTNLVVDINGATVSITTDIVKSSLTTAPSTNNTALVNDSVAADQADTRLWGEPLHYKPITIDTVGSEISALVGKFATFSINNGSSTEYFLAFVKSATSLELCYRGFFYNSSLSPVNRIFFSNNDVITLMSTAWIFVENDATTVDVTYNNPVWSFTSPGSPATGDYWYDLANNVWKRYDGASFQIINRTFIGIAVIDSSNCVAARCAEFFANFSPENTIDVEISTTEIVRSLSQNQSCSVYGTKINFGHSIPTWNITTDLATAADMYTASEQSSTQYYLYITDEGETVISDIQPYFRYDFYGRYHPHNPWRCVGMMYNNASSNIVQAGGFVGASEVIYNSPSGNGSGGQARNYSNLEAANGADIVAFLDGTEGARMDFYEPGVYVFYNNDVYSINNCVIGLEKNKSNFSDGVTVNITNDQSLAFGNNSTSNVVQCSSQPILFIGEYVRPMNNGNVDGTSFIYKFRASLVKRLFPY